MSNGIVALFTPYCSVEYASKNPYVGALGHRIDAGMGERVDMSTPRGLARALTLGWAPDPDRPRPDPEPAFDGTFCPSCGEERRMGLRQIAWRASWSPAGSAELRTPEGQPSLFSLRCLQCDHMMRVLASPEAEGGVEVFLIPRRWATGIPDGTPGVIAYALEQAERAQATKASSAAVVMYRRALEHLLADQGYHHGSLAHRIRTLLAAEPAPAWLASLDPEYLGLVKELGNAASHGDGGIAQREVFDEETMRQVHSLFDQILKSVYGPGRRTSVVDSLRSKLNALRDPD
jgi:uncharacterized protein DUF4145